jgi:DNA-binding transcriptional ArsR family regulator
VDKRLDPLAAHTALAASLKALSHPARLKILRLLAENGSCICGEVVEILPLAQSTVSQHLKVLREAGFVRGEIDGPSSCYCLEPKAIAKVHQDLDELFAFLSSSCPPTKGEKSDE